MGNTAKFYQLPAPALTVVESRRAICRVLAKAWQVLGKVDVLTPDAEALTAFDDLLWTFHAGAFVPHGRAANEPVYLFHDPALRRPEAAALALVEWQDPVPADNAVEHLIDFIPAAGAEREPARARYRQCKQTGYSIQLFPLEL